MADLSVLIRLDRLELTELVCVLAYGIGELPDRAVAEARFHAATRRAERASAACEAALADYTRTMTLYEKGPAEKRRPTLGPELTRLVATYRLAATRERAAWARVHRLSGEYTR